MRPQKRRLAIAMSPEEIDAFMAAERTCRVGTVGRAGTPHVSPLWFAWHDRCLWLYSLTGAQRWADLQANPAVSVVVDAGHDYGELRGVELLGTVEVVGDVPHSTARDPDPVLAEPERLFANKYLGQDEMPVDGRHAWLRLRPDKVVSWDFRKS
ncbi:MAG: pyridoxamine 5'-phosphate oxidase family protein [Acidimicrobiia bacterium]